MSIKLSQALTATGGLLRDPTDFAGGVRLFDSVADTRLLRFFYTRMLADLTPEERERLREHTARPVDLAVYARMAPGTLGRAYATYFDVTGFSPESQRIAHPPIAEAFARDWIYERFVRVHDFHHVLLDFSTDVWGEVGLQAFDFVNFGEPFGAMVTFGSPLVAWRCGDPMRLAREIAKGLRLGRGVPNLFAAPFEDWATEDLDGLRRRLGVTLVNS